MTYYIHVLTDDGQFEIIDGRYLDIYPKIKKENLHKITEEQVKEYYLNINCKVIYKDGKITYEVPQIDRDVLIQNIKRDLLLRLNLKLDSLDKQYLSSYPKAEIDSFERQIKEANGELPPLLLTEILAGYPESMTLEKLKAKVLEKADLHAIIRGALITKKQTIGRSIEAAKTIDELNNLEDQITRWTLFIQ